MDKIKWAVVGTGYIANEFGKGLMEVKDAILQNPCFIWHREFIICSMKSGKSPIIKHIFL